MSLMMHAWCSLGKFLIKNKRKLSTFEERGIRLRRASYKKIWHLLIDKDMNKKMLAEQANVSASTLSKLAKGESVNVDILIKICNALNCEIQDIIELVPNKKGANNR